MTGDLADLRSVERCLREVAGEAIVGSPYVHYVHRIQESLNAQNAQLFMLDLGKAAFVRVVPSDGSATSIPAAKIGDDLTGHGEIRGAIARAIAECPVPTSATSHTDDSSSQGGQLIVPLIRHKVVVGFLALSREITAEKFGPRDYVLAEALSQGLMWLKVKQQTADLFDALQEPIDYLQSTDGYYKEIVEQVALASGMPFVAIREYDSFDDTLRCLASYGFPTPSNDLLDLTPLEAFPTFAQAIRDRTVIVENDMSAAHLKTLMARPELSAVKSFVVVPVLVGKEVLGTLSFACPVKYDFSPLEVSGFETIANGVGVSIRNFRNVRLSETSASEKARKSMAFTAVQIAQVARHEALGFIDNIKSLLPILEKNLPQSQKETTKILSKNLLAAVAAINKIKSATQAPRRELGPRNIKTLWKEVFEDYSSRLSMENIKWDVLGKENIETRVYPDHLKHAFLNLVLNSMDAFATQSKRSGRKITVDIVTPSDSSNKIEMTYTDNAGGIDPSKLKLPEELRDQVAREGKDISPTLIFGEGVTSKETGSGFGLWLTQKILDEHQGSINLVSHRGGVQFHLSISKNL